MAETTDNEGPQERVGDANWLHKVEAIGDSEGRFFYLGTSHAALYFEAGPVLLVSFETVYGIRAGQPDALPFGLQLARENGWSCLIVMARTPTWFRDPSVYSFFDRFEGDGFFDGFERVVFMGAGMCGYAACAFSVACPGATVLAFAPQATLDSRRATWDDRFRAVRRRSFRDRYGYGPDMVQAADAVYLFYDPTESLDAMHAALFNGDYINRLPCPHLGPDVMGALATMGVLPAIVKAACDGAFTPAKFWQLYRARRDHAPYLKRLGVAMEDTGRKWLGAMLYRAISERLDDPVAREKLARLQTELTDTKPLPPPRNGKPG